MEYKEIEISKIFQKENSRSQYRNEDLQELMASMAQDGLLHPIGVSKNGDKFEVLFGNRRFMAAKKLGWHAITSSVIKVENEGEKDLLNLTENIKRTSIPAHDEGRLYSELMKKGLTTQEICAKAGVKMERVKSCLDVFQRIPKEFRDKIVPTMNGSTGRHNGKITANVASQLLSLSQRAFLNKSETKDLFDSSISSGLSMPQANSIAKMIHNGIPAKKAIENINKVEVVTLSFVVKTTTKNAIQKKYGKSYSKVVLSYLKKKDELGVFDSADKIFETQKPVTKIIRKSLDKY